MELAVAAYAFQDQEHDLADHEHGAWRDERPKGKFLRPRRQDQPEAQGDPEDRSDPNRRRL